MRTFNTGKITFEYPDYWEVENTDLLANPDCVATLSKLGGNLINVVMFPTTANLDDYKVFMEDTISGDGGIIIASYFVLVGQRDAIKLHANIDLPEINFDIHTYVFIENGYIYIFELRTIDTTGESIKEFDSLVSSFKIIV